MGLERSLLTILCLLQAVGVQSTENGGIAVTTKKPGNPQQPGQNQVTVTYGPKTATRKYEAFSIPRALSQRTVTCLRHVFATCAWNGRWSLPAWA
jgi:hypothetical protein